MELVKPGPDPDAIRRAERHAEYVGGLRYLADFLDRPAAADVIPKQGLGGLTVNVFCDSVTEFDERANALLLATGGDAETVDEGSFRVARTRFGPHKFDVYVNRSKIPNEYERGYADGLAAAKDGGAA